MEHASFTSEVTWNVFGLLLVALAILIFAKRTRLPFTVLLVLVGIGLAVLDRAYPESMGIFSTLEISPDLILYIFLPTLIFESSYNMDGRRLIHNLGPILMLAVPGLLISTMLIGSLVHWVTDIPFTVALLLGAILSATDPVAVVAIFRQMGAPERMTTLIEGESLFNDATSIVIASIIAGVVAEGVFDGKTLVSGIVDFNVLFIGGLAVGIMLGYLTSMIVGWVESEAFVEIGLTTALAYLSFLIAEDIFHVSGVMAVVGAGLTLGSWGRIRISSSVRIYMDHFWELFAFIANALLFLLVGMKVDLIALWGTLDILIWVILAMLLARAVIVFTLMPLVGRLPGSRPVEMSYQFIMFWGGLRGAIALAIVLSLPPFAYSELLTVLVMGAVLFTLLVQGLSIEPLMKKLGLNIPPLTDQVAFSELHIMANKRALERLPALQEGGVFSSRIAHQLTLDCDRAISAAKQEILDLRANEMGRMHEMNLLYLRALGEEKAFYSDMYDKGHFTEGAFREMTVVLNLQIDALRYHGEFAHVHSHRIRRMLEQRFYRLSRHLSWLSPYAEKMRMSRIVRNYEQVWGHYLGSAYIIQSMNRLAKLETFPLEAIKEVQDKYRSWHGFAEKQLYEVSEQFPEFVTSMQERLGQRLILQAELETTEERAEQGMLPESAARSLEESLAKRLSAIRGQKVEPLQDDPLSLLKTVPLFSTLTQQHLKLIAGLAETVSVSENEHLVHMNEVNNTLFLIARGVTRICSEDAHGVRKEGTLMAGEFFGEMALMGHGSANATVKTVMPCRLYTISRQHLLELLKKHPELDQFLQIRDEYLKQASKPS